MVGGCVEEVVRRFDEGVSVCSLLDSLRLLGALGYREKNVSSVRRAGSSRENREVRLNAPVKGKLSNGV